MSKNVRPISLGELQQESRKNIEREAATKMGQVDPDDLSPQEYLNVIHEGESDQVIPATGDDDLDLLEAAAQQCDRNVGEYDNRW
ncbi:MAG: hypothetical protein NTX72_01110 [Candidatus Uhrbacteria bacterium]|nr:hypothetical protein [Candidatus Uhrbacteria bacterium]